ncbi:MAG: dihydrolipoyl dehydrogenase family protein [Alphaproteobacteria bacterium]
MEDDAADTDIETDLCIIGAGAAGLSVAAGASQMGARVVLIEKTIRDGVMGGECLHTGCVPSKAMLAAAKQAKAMTQAGRFGIAPVTPQVDFSAVLDHVHGVIEAISPADTVERFEGLGVSVMEGEAAFVDPKTVMIEGMAVRAKRFVIAAGSRPAIPPIPGLERSSYLTNETIFDNRDLPRHLIIIGGGPIGMELAQAHRRLGAEVTVLERLTVLPNDDPETRAVVTDRLKAEGVDIRENVEIQAILEGGAGEIHARCEIDGAKVVVTGSHLLVAAGRQPDLESLNLDAAGVAYTSRGITVDGHLRTSNKRIYAIGDCADGGPRLTHMAGYQASVVVQNILFRRPAKSNPALVPAVTYTDPEIAQVGLSEAAARERHKDIEVVTWPVADNDRAQADRDTEGLIKVVARKNGKILGVSIAAPNAGELIQPWLLALTWGKGLSSMTGFVAPYPTLGEISKRVAGKFYTPFLFGPRVKGIVRLLLRLP